MKAHHIVPDIGEKTDIPGFTYAHAMTSFPPLQPGKLVSWDEEGSYRAAVVDHAVISMPASIETIRKGVGPDAFFVGIELDFMPNILNQIHTFQQPAALGMRQRIVDGTAAASSDRSQLWSDRHSRWTSSFPN